MAQPSRIFDHHYAQYLAQLAGLDLDRTAPAAGACLGSSPEGRALDLTYFNRRYRVSGRGILGPEGGTPGYDTCTILSRYLIMAGQRVSSTPSGHFSGTAWIGFRDLRDAGPLTVYFSANVEQVLARALAGKTGEALGRLQCLGAFPPDLDARYDLMLQFQGLPNIPLVLLFNDADDGFPPSCSLLFRADVEAHLDAECIAMMGHRLAALVGKCLGPAADG